MRTFYRPQCIAIGKMIKLKLFQETTGLSASTNAKKQGVSGQSLAVSRDINIKKHNKDFRSRTIIKEAIMENDFLKNLSQGQVR